MYRKIVCKILGFIKNINFFVNKTRNLYTIIEWRRLKSNRNKIEVLHLSDLLQNQK